MFDSPTTESTITLLNRGFREYGTPRDILTYDGIQFVSAWGRDLSSHSFKDFLDKNEINYITARVKHPHTLKPHLSLNLYEVETPDQAFWRRLLSERILNYAME